MSGARVAAARVLLTAPHASTLVKLCGMHRPEDVAAANAAGPDLVGFVVDFPRSHRSVPVAGLPALTAGVAPAIARVGVFVDEAPAVVAGLVASEAIDACQLHGHEDEAYLAGLRAELARAGVANAPVIQAFRVRERADVERAEASSADVILLDNGQGTGERFDWSLVTHVARPFILAGGIKDESKMRAAVAAVRSAR